MNRRLMDYTVTLTAMTTTGTNFGMMNVGWVHAENDPTEQHSLASGV
jgi:hypothetical protein